MKKFINAAAVAGLAGSLVFAGTAGAAKSHKPKLIIQTSFRAGLNQHWILTGKNRLLSNGTYDDGCKGTGSYAMIKQGGRFDVTTGQKETFYRFGPGVVLQTAIGTACSFTVETKSRHLLQDPSFFEVPDLGAYSVPYYDPSLPEAFVTLDPSDPRLFVPAPGSPGTGKAQPVPPGLQPAQPPGTGVAQPAPS